MRDTPDPNFHRQAQQRMVAHVQRLLEDERFAVDTTAGLKPVTSLVRSVAPGDDAIGVKRKMIELDLSDRELQRKMPAGQTLDITLAQSSLFGGQQPVGRLRVICLSPTESLLKGDPAPPLDALPSERPPPHSRGRSAGCRRRSSSSARAALPTTPAGWRSGGPGDRSSRWPR